MEEMVVNTGMVSPTTTTDMNNPSKTGEDALSIAMRRKEAEEIDRAADRNPNEAPIMMGRRSHWHCHYRHRGSNKHKTDS